MPPVSRNINWQQLATRVNDHFERILRKIMFNMRLTAKGTREPTGSPADKGVGVCILPWWCHCWRNRADSSTATHFWKLKYQFIASGWTESCWTFLKGAKLSKGDLLWGRGLRGWRLGLVPTGGASWAGTVWWWCIEDHSFTCVSVWKETKREHEEQVWSCVDFCLWQFH